MAGDVDTSSSSPNKRRKTLKSKIESEDDPTHPNPQETEDSSSQSCAICYLDDGKAIRGKIDCCDHYFCFLCIKEWSKTESRCPLCRRRFHTIRRPPKDGVFKRARTIKVPLRDQLPFGNTRSYEEVVCNVCHDTTDESLLLLCDHCDSAAHTYCVGLGNTVPEGDWFCADCTASRAENHTYVDSHSDDEDTIPAAAFGYCMRIPRIRDFTPPVVPDRCTGIADGVTAPARILPSVANRQTESVVRTLPTVANRPNQSVARTLPSVSNRLTEILRGVANRPTESAARTVPSVVNRPTESVARTLDRCRNVNSRIQALRENWNGFRSGSLSFPSSSLKSGCSSSQKHNNGVVFHEGSSQTQSLSSTSCQQMDNRDSCGSNDIEKAWKMMDIASSGCSSQKHKNGGVFHERSGQEQSSSSTSCQQVENRDSCGSWDINKAWKMMDIARSKQHAHENCSSAVQFSKLPSSRTSDSKKRFNASSCLGTSGQAQSSSSTGCQRPTNELGCGSHAIDKACEIMDTRKSKQHIHGNASSRSAVQQPKLLSRKSSASKEATNVNKCFDILKTQQPGARDWRRNGMEAYKCNSREQETINEGASSFYAKPELSTSSSTLDVQKRNIGGAESSVERKARQEDDAKSEIKSLVKNNLKLLSKANPLGYDAFKKIARLSTHTILAACGLEQPKPAMPSFPSLVCCHNEQFQLPDKSDLMPKSCRSCFYGFVKDVVSSILFDSAGSSKLS